MATKIAVITHRQSQATQAALVEVLDLCRQLDIEAFLPQQEVEKYQLAEAARLATVVPFLEQVQVDFCVALGGDGTILRAFNRFEEMRTPILGVNFGRIGFLSAIGPDEIQTRLKPVLQGQYRLLDLGLLELKQGERRWLAINDVVVHKPDGSTIVHLSYQINQLEIDAFQCDGMVVATPAGSTAYNMSTGGPLVSLGLEAMILTAVAPHTLRARALVLAAGETLTIANQSLSSTALIHIDGRCEGSMKAGTSATISLAPHKAQLVQAPDTNFYQTLRDKFICPPS